MITYSNYKNMCLCSLQLGKADNSHEFSKNYVTTIATFSILQQFLELFTKNIGM